MLILHLVGRSHHRGAERVAVELAAELTELGHRNELLAVGAGHDGATDPALPALVPGADQTPAVLVRAAWRLRRRLGEVRPDLVLAHGGTAAQVTALATPRGGPVLVWQRILGLPGGLVGLRRAWWRLAARRADGVVALTPDLVEDLDELGYRGPTRIIPNARRADRFADLDREEAGRRLRAEIGVGPATPIVGLVGHLVAQKDPVAAVSVLAGVTHAGVAAHLVVAGSGPLEAEVTKAVAALGFGDRVTMLGHRDDVEQVLGGIDVLVLTSRTEGIPGIVIEAAMAGCPVVTYPVGGVAAVVEDGVTGVVVARPDADLLAREVAQLLVDPRRRTAMGSSARARTASLSMEAVAGRYLALFEELLAART